jgi:hypothetical protein
LLWLSLYCYTQKGDYCTRERRHTRSRRPRHTIRYTYLLFYVVLLLLFLSRSFVACSVRLTGRSFYSRVCCIFGFSFAISHCRRALGGHLACAMYFFMSNCSGGDMATLTCISLSSDPEAGILISGGQSRSRSDPIFIHSLFAGLQLLSISPSPHLPISPPPYLHSQPQLRQPMKQSPAQLWGIFIHLHFPGSRPYIAGTCHRDVDGRPAAAQLSSTH